VSEAAREIAPAEACVLIGLFDTPDSLLAAIRRLSPKRIGRLEAYTPYPVHGLDEALGLRRSPLGGMVMVMGIVGALTAFGFQYWISAIDYPIVTGGKAPWSWEAFIPIMFETTVLFATFTAGLAMLILLNKLPFFGHPVLSSKAIASITRDGFALAIEAEPGAARAALLEVGARNIETLESPKNVPAFTSEFVLRTMAAIAGSCIAAGVLTYWAVKLFPELPPMSHMLDQKRLIPQQSSRFFADGHGMRLPPPGAIARGTLSLGSLSPEEAQLLVNPLPRDPRTFALGKQKFTERCGVCHGALADGKGTLTAAYGATPANLQARRFQDISDGEIVSVIVHGKNAMPSHAADLSPDERWAIVHYVRALQRAQNAKDNDVNLP
jgi:mono/diheme cytochrome c family protein